LPTTAPPHLPTLEHPDSVAARHSTRWVEDTLDLSGVAAPTKPVAEEEPAPDGLVAREVDVEVDGRRHHVKVWVPEGAAVTTARSTAPRRPRPTGARGGGAAGAGRVTVPMQGTILKVLVSAGDQV